MGVCESLGIMSAFLFGVATRARPACLPRAYPRVLGLAQAITKQPGIVGGPPRSTIRLRYSGGEQATSSGNLLENEPRLEKPTIMQISVTVRFADARRSLARSTRRRLR